VKKLLILTLLLSGCASWTPQQKKAAWVFAGFVAVSYALQEQSDSPAIQTCDDRIVPAGPQIPGQPAQIIVLPGIC
jgi:hypothetical protein